MAVTLAGLPLPWTAQAQLLDFGGDQTSAIGGVQSRFVRVGSRWAVTFAAMPALGLACARQLIAARLLARSTGSTVIAPFPQPPFAGVAAIGAPVMDGAGQAGGVVNVRGLTAGATIPAGVFFSVVVSGRSYLYQVTALVVANGTGRAALIVAPFFRASPPDGAALNFTAPNVEGFLGGAAEGWTLDRLAWFGVAGLSITEIQ